MTSHDDEKLRDRPVGGPQLIAVEDVVRAVLAQRGRRGESRRVRPHVFFGEGERGHGPGRESWEVALLLFLGPEHLQRLRDTDGLVCREKRHQTAVDAAHRCHHLVVFGLPEPEPAVFLGDLEAESPHASELVHHSRGDLAVPIDFLRVHGAQKRSELDEERPAALTDEVIRIRVGVDEIEPKVAQEHVANERGVVPFLLASGFGDAARLLFADLRAVLRYLLRTGHGYASILTPTGTERAEERFERRSIKKPGPWPRGEHPTRR
jgi:hypothetical protein